VHAVDNSHDAALVALAATRLGVDGAGGAAAGVNERYGCDAVERWLQAERRFQFLLARGDEVGSYILCERPLGVWSQTGGAAKADLVAQYAALADCDELCDGVRVALAGEFDSAAFGSLGGVVLDVGESTVCELRSEAGRSWPDALGGGASRGEIERRFVLHVRRATWRDRAVRRLSRLEVFAVELHADPVAVLATDPAPTH
jgi:hypothetical protein